MLRIKNLFASSSPPKQFPPEPFVQEHWSIGAAAILFEVGVIAGVVLASRWKNAPRPLRNFLGFFKIRSRYLKYKADRQERRLAVIVVQPEAKPRRICLTKWSIRIVKYLSCLFPRVRPKACLALRKRRQSETVPPLCPDGVELPQNEEIAESDEMPAEADEALDATNVSGSKDSEVAENNEVIEAWRLAVAEVAGPKTGPGGRKGLGGRNNGKEDKAPAQKAGGGYTSGRYGLNRTTSTNAVSKAATGVPRSTSASNLASRQNAAASSTIPKPAYGRRLSTSAAPPKPTETTSFKRTTSLKNISNSSSNVARNNTVTKTAPAPARPVFGRLSTAQKPSTKKN